MTRDLTATLDALGLPGADVEVLDTGWGTYPWVYLLTDGHRKMVLKVVPPSAGAARLRRRIALRSEAHIYRALEQVPWSGFRHPRLLATDRRTFLLIEFVEHATQWPPTLVDSVLDGLLEFQTRLPAGRWDGSGLMRVLRPSAPWRIMLASLTRRPDAASVVRLLRCLVLYARGRVHLARAAGPRLAQHGDLTYANIVVAPDGLPRFIDFQRTLVRQRLVFRDVVQLATELGSAAIFDLPTLRAYTRLWGEQLGRSPSEAAWQLRIALLLHTLYVTCCYPVPFPAQDRYRHFLEEVILLDAPYADWFAVNVDVRP